MSIETINHHMLLLRISTALYYLSTISFEHLIEGCINQ